MRPQANAVHSAVQTSGESAVAEAAFIAQAREKYENPSNDDIEIDESPVVSTSAQGAWIAAWVWVGRAEAGLGAEIVSSDVKAKRKLAKSQV
jgi:hypothetical protein